MTGQIFASCGVGLAAVYVLTESGRELQLAEVVEDADGTHKTATAYALTDRSPVADACRAGRPLWLTAEDVARYGTDSSEIPARAPIESRGDATAVHPTHREPG
ncbi:hypothetical protein U9R90_19375 [Streptomyces sp. E11-3]|uniref:hypothetical protein n=1 Tax=Streptomyces sp. E11-3 TaxID=3110112 RepID=UPI00397F7BED